MTEIDLTKIHDGCALIIHLEVPTEEIILVKSGDKIEIFPIINPINIMRVTHAQ